MDKQLLVYVDLDGEPNLVGRLWARARKGRESATFEYDASWLKHRSRFALEPALVLSHGPQHTAAGRRLFGAIARQELRFAFHSWGTDLEVLAAAHLGVCWPDTVVEWLEYPCYSNSGRPGRKIGAECSDSSRQLAGDV